MGPHNCHIDKELLKSQIMQDLCFRTWEMHLRASKLHVGRVDLAPQELVEGGKAGQDDGLVCALDAPAWQKLPSALVFK